MTSLREKNNLKQKIYELELSLLNPSVRSSPKELNLLLAEEFIEFGSSGRIYTKNDILKFLPLEEPKTYQVEDFAISHLSEDVVLATYKIRTDASFSLRSSIWKLNGKSWLMVFHQGTKGTR